MKPDKIAIKKTLLPALALIASLSAAQAQYFTNGNLAVVRIGGVNQSVTTTGGGNPVWIDQYTTNGTLANSFPIPSSGANALILNGVSYGGYLSSTPDGTRLVIGGFNTSAPYTSNGLVENVAYSFSTNVPRAVATIDGYGNYALPIVNSNIYNTYTITGAASDGSNFWTLGTGATSPGTSGLVYVGTALAGATNPVAPGLFGGGRGLNIYNNALYACGYTSNGLFKSAMYGSGAYMVSNSSLGALPNTASVYTNLFPDGTSSETGSDLVINPAGTLAYLADTSLGIIKFTNSGLPGALWVSNYTILLTNGNYTAAPSGYAMSVTADFTQTPVVLYATTTEALTNRLVSLQDTGTSAGANATITVLATGSISANGTNTFRGVRFVPGSAPLITSPPSGVAQNADGTATFTASTLGTPPLWYQWYTNGVAVSGATNSSFTLNTLTTFQNGTAVYVVVSNAYGMTISSNAMLTVNPNYFSPGNLAVVQMGTATQAASANGEPVSIVQFTTAGAQVGTLPLPSTGPNAFILDNSATEGFMSLTPNGQYLVLGGYNTNIQTSSLTGFTSTNVFRAVATMDGYGNYALPITNANIFSTYNIRGAVSDGLGNFWVSGSGGTGASIANGEIGIIYVGNPLLQTNVTVTETGTGNERCLNIYNNTLYLSTGSGSGTYGRGIYMVSNSASGGIPTNTGSLVNNTNIMQTGSSSGPYDFVINAAGTVAYVAEDNLGGIIKFTNSGLAGGLWISNYTISALTAGAAASGTNAEGVTANFAQNPPVIYATTGESTANRLIQIVDNGASATATLLANAPAGTIYRGVRFVPGVPPTITNQPAPFTQDAGGSVTFTLGASGTPVLGYQWYTNGVAVSGATNSSVTLASLTTNQNGTVVSAVVTNSYGSATTTGALLTVQPPGAPLNVSITSPSSQTVNAGSAASFNVSAVGTSLTFIWKLNGAPLSNGGSVSGASTANLTISPAYATYNGTYTVIASNSFGVVAANNSAALAVIDPVILVQPVGTTNLPNTSSSLSVTAAGAPPLTYQWLSNGVVIAGARGSSYSLANGGTTAAATYSVIVSNNLGNSITSAPTVISFTPLLLLDTFSYANGNLFGDAGSLWTDINGSNPELVINGRVQIAQTNATTDAQRSFTRPVGNTVVWASFLINLTTLPTNAGGTYFANIEDNNFNFFGRIFTLTTNPASFTPGMSPAAFPGTYRLGIADTQNDFAGTATTGPNAVVPLDLAPGIDYQVVYFVDLVNQYSAMSVNPASLSDVMANNPGGVSSGAATDSFLHLTNSMAAFGLRQRQGEGIMQMDNLEVSYDWNGAGSGYAAVTGGMTATNPVIGLQPVGTTNYSGNPYVMEVAASGIGTAGSGLTYAWYQNGVALTDGGSVTGSATPALTLNSLVATNSGTYYVTVKGAVGSALQSSNAIVSVNSTPTAPVFSVNPAPNTTVSEGASVTFTSFASGTGPITYQWYGLGVALSGANSSNLTLTGLQTNQSGFYWVVATGGTGLQTQSSPAALTVTGPKSVTIGYLRSLLNPTTYQPSDQTTLFNVTGVITTATNQTTGNTASYYLQDITGGINLFVTFGSDFRPQLGDVVTATGTLSSYVDNYELDVSEGGTGYVDTILSHNSPLPTPILLPWGNNPAPLSASIATNVEGSIVLLTNLYFQAYAPGAVFASGTDYIVTNASGQSYTVFVSDQDTNCVTGKLIPQFAYAISGPLIQDDLTVGISFTVYSNLVTAPPPSATVTGAHAGPGGSNFTLAWTAIPYDYTYSVLTTTNLSHPWTKQASGLWFSTANGTYTDAGPTNTEKFYQITSP
jgi:hypothetical protein